MTVKQMLMFKGLTAREAEVAELIATGIRSKNAADQLCLCEKSIKFHLTNIYRKLGLTANRRTALAILCASHALHDELKADLAETKAENNELKTIVNKHVLPHSN